VKPLTVAQKRAWLAYTSYALQARDKAFVDGEEEEEWGGGGGEEEEERRRMRRRRRRRREALFALMWGCDTGWTLPPDP